MSFLRHREIYQVLEPSLPDLLFIERARPSGHALTHRLDESPVGYSWRVALQQSPLPLHQPPATLRQSPGDLQDRSRQFLWTQLNLWSHFRGAPQSPLLAPLCRLHCS